MRSKSRRSGHLTDVQAAQKPVSTNSSMLSLDAIRAELVKEEDTILFHLFERTHHPVNAVAYAADALTLPGVKGMCLLNYVLMKIENIEAQLMSFRKIAYHPFFPESYSEDGVASPELPSSAQSVNVNGQIYDYYLHSIMPRWVLPSSDRDGGDDGDYMASVHADIHCLQALSRRIHLGKYVAEAKFRGEPERYTTLIKTADREGIMDALTHADVEEVIIDRVRSKALRYDLTSDHGEVAAELYRDWIIPLTKEVEVETLLCRFQGTAASPLTHLET